MKVKEKHALWLRCVHWLNVPFLFLMIWSGTLIYWANDVYPGFFPAWFYETFHIDHRLAQGMAVHFTVAWCLILNGCVYVLGLFVSRHWRDLFPNQQALRDLKPTILHDLGLQKEAPPQGLFNAAQKFAYSGVLLLAILEVLTGFAIYKPVQLGWLTRLLGGYEMARLLHFAAMIGFVLFFFLHILQVIRSGWNNFRSMVVGFEETSDED